MPTGYMVFRGPAPRYNRVRRKSNSHFHIAPARFRKAESRKAELVPVAVPALGRRVIDSFAWASRPAQQAQQSRLPDPRVELCRLNRELRRAKILLGNATHLPAKPWSASHRWNLAVRNPLAAAVNRLEKQIAAHRDRFNLPVIAFFKPRPETRADRRIARQYDSKATALAFPRYMFDIEAKEVAHGKLADLITALAGRDNPDGLDSIRRDAAWDELARRAQPKGTQS